MSLAQCALGLLLAGSAVPDGDSGRAGSLFAAVNRLDGVKMLALVVSGVGYLLLSSTLAPVAFVSGPLLLLWVAGAGISLRD